VVRKKIKARPAAHGSEFLTTACIRASQRPVQRPQLFLDEPVRAGAPVRWYVDDIGSGGQARERDRAVGSTTMYEQRPMQVAEGRARERPSRS
jgi:hypothetical protein